MAISPADGVQDEDQAEENDDAHAERSRGMRFVSIRDVESAVCHVRLRPSLGANAQR
jgi:hypothetical protein